MFNNLSSFFYKHSNLFLVVLFTVLTFGYLFLVMIPQAEAFEIGDSTMTKSLGTSFGFSAEEVTEFLEPRSTEQLTAYQKFNTIWDNLFAGLYGLMYIFMFSLLFKPFRESVKILNLLPIVMVFFDWMENLKLAEMANDFIASGQFSLTDASLASFASMAKWGASGLIFLALVVGVILRIRERWSKRQAA